MMKAENNRLHKQKAASFDAAAFLLFQLKL
jgi:hypothetical protein